MFPFLVTVFSVSLAGLIVLVSFKNAELKTGKILFLPVWLKEKDGIIEIGMKEFARNFYTVCSRLVRMVWNLLCEFKRLPDLLLSISARRFPKRPENNGGGSVYLKQVMEHKNSVRNGEENAE